MKTPSLPRLIPLCLLSLMFTSTATADEPGLNEVEKSIVAFSQTHAEEAIDLLEKLVNINSGTMNQQGVREVGAVLRAEFDALGFDTRWVEMPEDMQRGGHLFASQEGERGKKILLIGHLDTVFEPDDAFQTFKRDGFNATGPGVEDMKSGNVIILYALKALQQAGVLEGAQIVVAYTGDEEEVGRPLQLARHDLIEAGKWADIALGFESGIEMDGKEWATIARRSSSRWCLEVSGQQAHSSGIFKPEYGAGAIFEAARILNGFYEEVRGEEYLTFNAGTIMGGTETDGECESPEGRVFGKTNVIPNRVIVRGGMRTISDDQMHRARAAMQAVVDRHLPVTDATITFTDSYPAMAPTEGNHRLRDMLSAINQQLGGQEMPILDVSLRGAADISFVAPYTDGLAGMGAYGDGGHTPNESLQLDSIPIAVQRAAILIYRLSR